MNDFGAPNFTILGCDTLVLDLGGPHTLEKQKQIWRLHARARAWDEVRESVPGLNNLTLLVDPAADVRAVQAACIDAWNSPGDIDVAGRSHVIPVRFGNAEGPDLTDVATITGLRIPDVIECYCAPQYRVYFVGFQPGFAYLGDLDERLAVPRRAQPRARVPAGSVAIGGSQAGVYPFASPGGWNIIGRTEVTLFDARRDPAALFAPGDIVRFVAA